MTEVAFRAAHHQHDTIQHLKYENDLLLRRNQLLAQENAKLLSDLEMALQRVENNQAQKIEKIAEQQQQLMKKAQHDSTILFHGIDNSLDKVIGAEVAAYRECLNRECSLDQLYGYLTQIIQKLLEQKGKQRETKLRGLINKTEERLATRRQARQKTQQVVHLIRQPPKDLLLDVRGVRDEIEQQRDIYQRIIRKVKRQSVNMHSLDQIYQQIDQMLVLRCSIRQEQRKLALIEREFQLGKFSPLSHQTTSSLITNLKDSLKHIKKCIQANIHSFQ